jgi:hypothetical protein
MCADLKKFFRQTSWLRSSAFSHQDGPPDGNEAFLGDRQLKRIRFSLASCFSTAGKSYVFDSLAALITCDVVPPHAWAKQAIAGLKHVAFSKIPNRTLSITLAGRKASPKAKNPK